MIPSVRETVEQAILLSVGAASLTRERVEGIVAELVRQGRMSGEEGRAMVERLVSRTVKGEGRTAGVSGVVGQLESGLRSAFREAGLVTRADLDDVTVQLAELEHRIRLLEAGGAAVPLGAAADAEAPDADAPAGGA